MTPPPYLVPGALSDVQARNRKASTVKLEYGDPAWIFAEQRYYGWAAKHSRGADGRAILRQLKKVGQAVSAFFF